MTTLYIPPAPLTGNQFVMAVIIAGVFILWLLFGEDIARWFRANFSRLRSWYTANRKYEGFVAFVVFGFGTIFLLVGNIFTDAKPIDWVIWIVWLQTVLYNASSWQNDKRHRDMFEFYEELLRHAHESEYAAIENSEQYHRWLVSGNRRRKRAEKQLKHAKKMYRFALEKNIELIQCTICGVRPSPLNEIKANQP